MLIDEIMRRMIDKYFSIYCCIENSFTVIVRSHHGNINISHKCQWSKFLPYSRQREDSGRGGKRFSSTSSSTDEGCISGEGDLEEGGDELREAQIKLEEHRLGLDQDISQRIDSQIVNRRLSDYQHHFDNPFMEPIDPPTSRTTLFMAGGSGSSSSELFESSFDSGCPPDYTGTNCFTSSLPSCTPPPPKSPSPITGRISRVSQGRRASDGGPRLLFCQQSSGDRPSKQRSIQGTRQSFLGNARDTSNAKFIAVQ